MASSVAWAQTTATPASPVTVDNYNRAQTDVNFAGVVKNGGFGKFRHGRELAPPVQQGIVRPNRDTLYSFAIVDLDAGPVTIALPDAGKRFAGRDYIVGTDYSIVDMSAWGWIDRASRVMKREEEPLAAFPNIKRWFEKIDARPAVARARAVGTDHEFKKVNDEETKRALFPSNFPEAAQWAARPAAQS
ncbi:DUF1254 domain-containing protein [Mesorhizobium sp. BH1-1-5]|uniref:DUF1254 domain-containing protein n=1 Tax=Mesorhizobium sp. BH1-1-5 TaxID=2876661 RepID=UPI001CCF2569|nr:DUF1254 domain-containing protein [Mesorhizobium sp. BH1-1-5]MBZ9989556.1 DUF1254 domain-containing protein [Mesorhizobium sp. BH1-1-5]